MTLPIYILFLLWSALGIFAALQNLTARKFSLASQDMAESGQMNPEWLPFVRNDRSSMPSVPILIFRSFVFGPIFLSLSVLSVIICGLASITLPTNLLLIAVSHICKLLCLFLGIRVREIGSAAAASIAPCIVANHNSAFDILVLLRNRCCFVAMDGVRNIPVIGPVAAAIGCIFVTRDSKDSRTATKAAIATRLNSQLSGTSGVDAPLVVFPEGSTENGKYLLQFRRGAFEANVPVQPLWIEFENHVLNFTVISLSHLICLACSLGQREVTLHWLPVIMPNRSPDVTSTSARDAIANCTSAYGHPKLIKQDTASHREAIACSKFFLEQRLHSNKQD